MTAGKVATAGPGPQRIRRGVAVGFVLVVGLVVAGSRAGADTEVHLTAAGDFGARAATDGVLRKVAELDPDAHLALGDLAYQDVATEDAWCSYVKARTGEGFPFQLLAGNHESLDVPDGAINDFSACLPNQVPGAAGTYGRQYHFDLPSAQDPMVRVIQISPGLTFEDGLWSYAAGSPRLQWVSDAIDSGRAAGANWIVVSAHLPCFSVGGYGCPTAQKDLYDLLVAKRVDVVLHGHEHAYMRTHQLRSGAGCATVPAGGFDADCVSDSDGAFTAGAGTVFATVGTGGIPLRNIDPNDAEAGYFAAFSGLNANPTFGLLDLRFTESSLTAQFVGTSGEGFSDSFTIAQGPPNLHPPPPSPAPPPAWTSRSTPPAPPTPRAGPSPTCGTSATAAPPQEPRRRTPTPRQAPTPSR